MLPSVSRSHRFLEILPTVLKHVGDPAWLHYSSYKQPIQREESRARKYIHYMKVSLGSFRSPSQVPSINDHQNTCPQPFSPEPSSCWFVAMLISSGLAWQTLLQHASGIQHLYTFHSYSGPATDFGSQRSPSSTALSLCCASSLLLDAAGSGTAWETKFVEPPPRQARSTRVSPLRLG